MCCIHDVLYVLEVTLTKVSSCSLTYCGGSSLVHLFNNQPTYQSYMLNFSVLRFNVCRSNFVLCLSARIVEIIIKQKYILTNYFYFLELVSKSTLKPLHIKNILFFLYSNNIPPLDDIFFCLVVLKYFKIF